MQNMYAKVNLKPYMWTTICGEPEIWLLHDL